MSKAKTPWEMNYQMQQEKINHCARCYFHPRLKAVDRILVYHPDEYRRYLRQHPCEGCRVERFCDLPCEVYLKWYNFRMEVARMRGRWKA